MRLTSGLYMYVHTYVHTRARTHTHIPAITKECIAFQALRVQSLCVPVVCVLVTTWPRKV